MESINSAVFTVSKRAKYQRITICPDKTIKVTIPENGSFTEAKRFLKSKSGWVRKQLKKIDERAKLRNEYDSNIDLEKAQIKIFERLEYFSVKYNFPYNRTAFRCQKTRWASCSGKNNISLNINIAYLPQHLQDYILLHELVHTKVKNHSRKFWTELDKYTKNRARELSRELKKHSLKLQL